jgi:hypothetical protein
LQDLQVARASLQKFQLIFYALGALAAFNAILRTRKRQWRVNPAAKDSQ